MLLANYKFLDMSCVSTASPHWRHDRPLADFTVDDEEDVDIECQSHGRPRPDITWSVNGTEINC